MGLSAPTYVRKWLDTGAKIQAEIDRLGSSGGYVKLAPTTIPVSEVITLNDDICVTGDGRFISVLQAQAGQPHESWQLVKGNTKSDVVIGSLGKNRVSVQNIGVDVNNVDAAGIGAFGGQRIVLQDNYVVNASLDSGVQVYGNLTTGAPYIYDAILANNIVHGALWGVVVDGFAKNVVVANNAIVDAICIGVSVDATEAVDSGNGAAVNVIGNTVRNRCDSGLFYAGILFRGPWTQGIIQGNTLLDVGVGIRSVECRTKILGNTIFEETASQIEVGIDVADGFMGSSITDNLIYGATEGIKVSGTTNSMLIRDNQLLSTITPMNLSGRTAHWVVEDNVGDAGEVLGSNYIGSVTLSGGTAAVSLGVTEPDANYEVFLTGSVPEAFGVSGKTTTGFTITSSNASSTARVVWQIKRN